MLIFNKLGLLKKSAGNIAAFAGVGVTMIGAIVFMWYTYSPMSNDGRLFRYIVPVVPNVRGEVVEVPINGLETISAGETLFRIDPEPYEITVRQLEAQVERHQAEYRLARTNVERARELVKVQSAAKIDLDTWTANMEVAEAAVKAASAQLDYAETNVTAPYEGYVLNLQLRPGSVVTTVPLAAPMAFVSYETNSILASFSQSAIRRVAVGDNAEIVFTNLPGQTFPGRVDRIVAAGSTSQMTASSALPALTGAPASDRWGVIIELDDQAFAKSLPQGAGGTVAV